VVCEIAEKKLLEEHARWKKASRDSDFSKAGERCLFRLYLPPAPSGESNGRYAALRRRSDIAARCPYPGCAEERSVVARPFLVVQTPNFPKHAFCHNIPFKKKLLRGFVCQQTPLKNIFCALSGSSETA